MLKKKLFKYRIKLVLSYIKTAILIEFFFLWMFSPPFAGVCLSKMFVLGRVMEWILAIQCILMVYFNIKLVTDDNFIILKWFKKLETEQDELRYDIWEEKSELKRNKEIL